MSMVRRRGRVGAWASFAFLAVSSAVLVVGLVLFLQSRNEPKKVAETFSTRPAQDYKEPKKVPLSAEAKRVAVTFINTAVARKNLAEAWKIVGPGIRQGQSFKQWMTGNIAVVPYPVGEVERAPIKIDWSYPNDASLEIALLPKRGSKEKPQVFHLGLKRMGSPKRWVVNYWAPYAPPALPDSVGS